MIVYESECVFMKPMKRMKIYHNKPRAGFSSFLSPFPRVSTFTHAVVYAFMFTLEFCNKYISENSLSLIKIES